MPVKVGRWQKLYTTANDDLVEGKVWLLGDVTRRRKIKKSNVRRCSEEAVEYLLYIFCFFFALLGLGVIGFGIYVFLETKNYMEFLTSDYIITVHFLIILGVVICTISIVGWYAFLRRNRCLIGCFIIIQIIILMFELFGGFASSIVQRDIQNGVKSNMKEAMEEYRSNPTAWDYVQKRYHCCGISGRDDWVKVPNSCCMVDINMGNNCGDNVNNTYVIGCLHCLVEQFLPIINVIPSSSNTVEDITIVTGLVVSTICFQLFGILFGFCFACFIGIGVDSSCDWEGDNGDGDSDSEEISLK